MNQAPTPGGRHSTLAVEPLLQPGERLLWEGGPDPRVVFARQDAFLVPFSLLWLLFAVVLEAGAIAARTAVATLLAAPLVVCGLYIVAGRFLYKWRDRRRTRYALTDQRALVVRLGGRQVLHAPVGGPMAVLRRRDGRHGSVVWAVLGVASRGRVLTFSGGNATMLRGTGWPLPAGGAVRQVAFFDVDRFDELMVVVTRAREAAGVTESPRTLAPFNGQPLRGQPYGASPSGGQPFGVPPPVLPPVPQYVPRPPAPPAGWYPDPDPSAHAAERWWDGVGWTFHVRPAGGTGASTPEDGRDRAGAEEPSTGRGERATDEDPAPGAGPSGGPEAD